MGRAMGNHGVKGIHDRPRNSKPVHLSFKFAIANCADLTSIFSTRTAQMPIDSAAYKMREADDAAKRMTLMSNAVHKTTGLNDELDKLQKRFGQSSMQLRDASVAANITEEMLLKDQDELTCEIAETVAKGT